VKEQDLTSSTIHEPSASETCLLIIDMINAFTFPDAEQLLPTAVCAATNIAKLKERAVRAGVPTIYVNDNFGHGDMIFVVSSTTALRFLAGDTRLLNCSAPPERTISC
jgi:isochorismatase family protein